RIRASEIHDVAPEDVSRRMLLHSKIELVDAAVDENIILDDTILGLGITASQENAAPNVADRNVSEDRGALGRIVEINTPGEIRNPDTLLARRRIPRRRGLGEGIDSAHVANQVEPDDVVIPQDRVTVENAPPVRVDSPGVGHHQAERVEIVVFDEIASETHGQVDAVMRHIMNKIM